MLILSFLFLDATQAHAEPKNLFQRVGFDQHLDAQLPLDTRFRDAAGQPVRLGRYFKDRPVVLVLGYFECPNLCGIVWRGLLETIRPMTLEVGRDFDLVAISIDPKEGPEVAQRTRERYLHGYGDKGSETGWHFLTGDAADIRRVADRVGFRYVYDPEIEQYAHASGLVVTTPKGKVSRYLFGVRYKRTDLRLALVESSGGGIGSPVDQLLLLCYHYDPATGQYGLLIMNVLRAAGGLTLGGLIGFVVLSRRRERDRAGKTGGPSTP